MQRRLLTGLLAAAALSSCKPTVEGAGVTADVTVASNVKADCVSVTAVSMQSGATLESNRVKRKGELFFGIAEGMGLSGTIQVTANGWLGACDDTATLNAQTAPSSATFVEGSTMPTVELRLDAALDDADMDGYRAQTKGGLDCDDTSAAVHPGAAEVCDDGLDNDCNGKTDCKDTVCEGAPCNTGLSCASAGICMAGQCLNTGAGCNAPPPTGCYHGPPSCGVDGGCMWQFMPGGPCEDGGTCRPDATCAPFGTEWNCADGLDNDHDMLIDCADPDCVTYACNDGDACTDGDVCQGDGGCAGAPRVCSMPPSACFSDAGTCVLGSCVYTPTVGVACDDNDVCTSSDFCQDDGGCAGALSVTCIQVDDGGCFSSVGVCVPGDGGCAFPARGGFACDDGISCTRADVCSDAGVCGGTTYTCMAPAACQTGAGMCLGDGGCTYPPTAAGTLCDGGLCSGTGSCLPSVWTYAPSNFSPLSIPESFVYPPLTIDCPAVFNTDNGYFTAACGTQVYSNSAAQDGGPAVALLALAGLQVTGSLRVEGSRALIIAVYGDFFMDGGIDVSTSSRNSSPGAGAMSAFDCGLRAGANGTTYSGGTIGGGGGGASWGSPGTHGGSQAGGDAGVVLDAGALVPLIGGCPGGYGALGIAGSGGQGGGALQISASGHVIIAGVVTASGAGGTHGNTDYSGGGGAGSGGSILIEGTSVLLTSSARITTNGGGGGEGAGVGVTADDGDDGQIASATPADGGSGATSGGGNGGNGATSTTPATVPEDGTQGGGGGGGGLGRFRMNGYPACTVQSGALISAAATQNTCN